ncbi:Peptidylglycine alpha-amidating monooxygenase,Probable peptidylglycine alpha-hydroxylating [Octopus vulgaris]|uniref:Peptidylglycine alpha-amidating monooxygenase,Probable peptidylglycine alpha-hydroxylating n=1 Tax=Octopus vulgaris TaxID=6645 RepID=A0AA36B4U8_OCTVU|nr:Peptidylglycine alpha-amidating monooxygenase,Probable peptidylglycine alpha-hydroxylating [Octopus vulgaris]
MLFLDKFFSSFLKTHSVLCATIKVAPDSYIYSFQPIRKPKTVRHISVALCDAELDTTKVWDCKTPKEVCPNGYSDALWAGAKDAPGWNLPKDYAFHVKKNYNYVVVQIHAPVNMTLNSTKSFNRMGVKLGITTQRPKYIAALALFGNMGFIPANTKDFPADTACNWKYSDTPLFAFGIHSHTMATAITGYVYSNNSYTEIVRADPRYPECKYSRFDGLSIYTFECESIGKMVVYEHTDQMCNLNLWFGIPKEYGNAYKPFVCGRDAQKFSLEGHGFVLPENANKPDIEGYKKLMSQFNLTMTSY